MQACKSGNALTCRAPSDTVGRSGRVPMPGPGEVLIQVLARGITAADLGAAIPMLAQPDASHGMSGPGLIPFPRLQGPDLCGRVVKLGAGVAEPRVGARVLCAASLAVAVEGARAGSPDAATERDRPIAELCLVPTAQLMDVSASVLTDLDTDALHWAYGTAHGLLARGGVRRGDKVLISDASSSIGMAAVRLAQLRGARVTGQCRAENAEAVLAAGAVATLARDGDLAANSFAAIIDVTGGTGWRGRIGALRPGGRYAALGALAGNMVEDCLYSVYLNDLTLFGRIGQSREVFPGLVTLVTSGGLPVAPSTRPYPTRGISKMSPASTAARIPPGNLHRVSNERQDDG